MQHLREGADYNKALEDKEKRQDKEERQDNGKGGTKEKGRDEPDPQKMQLSND